MKAARIHEFGWPSVIVVEDVARPTPGPGEVLVRVAASGLDHGTHGLDRIRVL